MSKVQSLASMSETVRRLYVEENLSITDVRSELIKLGHTFSRWDVGALIKQLGIMRDRRRAALTSRRKHNGWHYRPKERMCRLCHQSFNTHSPGAMICETCAPDGKARGRALRYGITQKQYDEMITRQDDRCGICQIDLKTLSTKMVHIDHCHITQRVRGILCKWCNVSLGHLEKVGWLERAQAYQAGNT